MQFVTFSECKPRNYKLQQVKPGVKDVMWLCKLDKNELTSNLTKPGHTV